MSLLTDLDNIDRMKDSREITQEEHDILSAKAEKKYQKNDKAQKLAIMAIVFAFVAIGLSNNASITYNNTTISNGSGTLNHANLTNLTWSTANHTIDTYIDMNENGIISASATYDTNISLLNNILWIPTRNISGGTTSWVTSDGDIVGIGVTNGSHNEIVVHEDHTDMNINATTIEFNQNEIDLQNKNIQNSMGIGILSNASYSYLITSAIPNGVRPYQFKLNLSNSTGVNTNTSLYCNGHCYTNFSDVWFSIGALQIPHKIINATGSAYINATINGTITMHYGNISTVQTAMNPNMTLPLFDTFDYNTTFWNYTQSVPGNVQLVLEEVRLTGNNVWDVNGITAKNRSKRPVKIEWDSRFSGGTVDSLQGYSPNIPTYPIGLYWEVGGSTALYRLLNGTRSADFGTLFGSTMTHQKILLNSTGYTIFYNNAQKESNTSWTTDNFYVGFQMFRATNFMYIDNVTVMDFVWPEPELYQWSSETIETTYLSGQKSWCVRVASNGGLFTTSGAC